MQTLQGELQQQAGWAGGCLKVRVSSKRLQLSGIRVLRVRMKAAGAQRPSWTPRKDLLAGDTAALHEGSEWHPLGGKRCQLHPGGLG